MKYEIIQWDSEFFGFKIARIDNFTTQQDFEQLLKQLKLQHIRLVYSIANPDNQPANQIFSQYANLVDQKTTYYQKIEPKQYQLDPNIEKYNKSKVDPQLIDLAFQSGEYSRFKIDPKLPKGSFEKLYTKWIENSVKHQFDDEIYVYKTDNKIVGLLTLKNKNNIGTISLIGVDQRARGQNIGTKLINATFFHYSKIGIFDIEVVTQKQNQFACKFYEKNNFKIKKIENIYHLWL